MLNHLAVNKVIFLLTGGLAVLAAGTGLLAPQLYEPVVSDALLPGVFTQDLVVILAALLLLFLAATLEREDDRKTTIVLGILGFFFYAYGIYAIEQVYTALYPVYLALVALAFYGVAFALASLDAEAVAKLRPPRAWRLGAAVYGVLIAVMFNVIWIGQLLPLLREGDRIEYTFSVYVIDLVFIMPAFLIAALLAVRGQAVGVVGLPALFVMGVGILGPLALAEILKPLRYGLATNHGDLWLFGVLSTVFLLLAAGYLSAFGHARARRADRLPS